jgi:hypothetical protein
MIVKSFKTPFHRATEDQTTPIYFTGVEQSENQVSRLYGVHAPTYEDYTRMTQDELQRVIDTAIKTYQGDISVLEAAIGALHIGLKIGWKPLRLVHSHKTFTNYQKVLGLDFHEVLPEVGVLADKSMAWRIAKYAHNFWDVARGTLPGRSKELAK